MKTRYNKTFLRKPQKARLPQSSTLTKHTMNKDELICRAVRIFESKKENKEIVCNKVFRGRSASSSDIEDLLGEFIANIVHEQHILLVDYPLSFKIPCQTIDKKTKRQVSTSKSRRICPDISIINSGKLIGIIEIKIDLGFLGNDWIESNNEKIDIVRNCTSISYKSNNGSQNKITVCDQCKYCIVVISSANSRDKEKELKKVYDCFVLFGDKHPNDPTKTEQEKIVEITNGPNEVDAFEKYLEENYC